MIEPIAESTTFDYRVKNAERIALAVATGDLVYIAHNSATVTIEEAKRLRRQAAAHLTELLKPRALELVDRGAFYFEVRAVVSAAAMRSTACAIPRCGGQVWCGRCRRCGTKP
jgi:hypothetical protein